MIDQTYCYSILCHPQRMLRKHPFYTSLSIKNDKQLKMIHITLQFQVIDPLIAYEATKKKYNFIPILFKVKYKYNYCNF